MKLVVRTSARTDIILQVMHLRDEFAMDAAARFPDAVDEALEQIQKPRYRCSEVSWEP